MPEGLTIVIKKGGVKFITGMNLKAPVKKTFLYGGFKRDTTHDHGHDQPPFLVQNECDSSPFDYQSILIKDHFIGTANNILNTDLLLF